MSNLVPQVTPLTRGIIWLSKDAPKPANEIYKGIDYLLDGLLTSSLKEVTNEHQIFLGQNFGNAIYVLITSEVNKAQLENFMTLVKNGLTAESDILVIDEMGAMGTLQKSAPEDLAQKLKLFL